MIGKQRFQGLQYKNSTAYLTYNNTSLPLPIFMQHTLPMQRDKLIRPLLLASNRLIFVLPHRIKGEEKEASSLITDMLERCNGSEHIMVEVRPETVLQHMLIADPDPSPPPSSVSLDS